MTMPWMSGAGVTAYLRGPALAVLFLLGLAACDDSHTVKLYVFPDWIKLEEQLGKLEIEAYHAEDKQLFVNG